MPSDLYNLEIDDDVAVLILYGNIGSLIAEQGLQTLVAQALQPGLKGVVVDFARLSYFGSSLLEALRHIWTEVTDRDGKLALCSVSEVGREILHISRFDTLWPICTTRQEALALVRQP